MEDDNTNSTQPTFASGLDSNLVCPRTVDYSAMPLNEMITTVIGRIDPPHALSTINIRSQNGLLQHEDCGVKDKKNQRVHQIMTPK